MFTRPRKSKARNGAVPGCHWPLFLPAKQSILRCSVGARFGSGPGVGFSSVLSFAASRAFQGVGWRTLFDRPALPGECREAGRIHDLAKPDRILIEPSPAVGPGGAPRRATFTQSLSNHTPRIQTTRLAFRC